MLDRVVEFLSRQPLGIVSTIGPGRSRIGIGWNRMVAAGRE